LGLALISVSPRLPSFPRQWRCFLWSGWLPSRPRRVNLPTWYRRATLCQTRTATSNRPTRHWIDFTFRGSCTEPPDVELLRRPA